MSDALTFDAIFEVMSAASVGDERARVALPEELDIEDIPTRFAIALNLLLDDLALHNAEVRASERRLATTLDSIGDAVIATDVAARVVRMNPVAERLTGWSVEEAIGRSLTEVFQILNEETRRPVESPVDRVLREGIVVGLANHTTLVSRDGRERPIADSGAPIRDEDGTVHGVVLVFRDQTEERAAELARLRAVELDAASRKAQEASRLKSEFLANMSHELRTPLNSIIGFGELLHDQQVGPLLAQQREFVGYIVGAGKHLLHLINEILDLSKVEAGKMTFVPAPVDPAGVLSEVITTLHQAAAVKHLQITTRVDDSLGTIELDPARLKQVLYNYVSNAIKFTPTGGRVEVRVVAEAADLMRIEVEDTGAGIAPEDIKRLFVEFQQLDAGSSKSHGGTGLGLALTRRLVEAQGGSVGVDSVLGRGSIFHAILPRRIAKVVTAD